MKQINIGLVLSGGGARGAYQLGVMLAMEKYGFRYSWRFNRQFFNDGLFNERLL